MSERKDEFQNLREYFDRLVTLSFRFLAIVTVLGSVLFVYDRASLRNKIEGLENDYTEAIADIKEKAEFQIEVINTDVDRQISSIVRSTISNELDKKNISNIIDSYLKHAIEYKVSNELRVNQNDILREVSQRLNEIADISDATLKARIGHRDGIPILDNLIKNSKFSENRARAQELKTRIEKDYFKTHNNTATVLLYQTCNLPISNDTSIEDLYEIISSEDSNLNKVSCAIILLNREHDTNFKPFEYSKIKEWYENISNK